MRPNLASSDFVPMGPRMNQQPPQVHPMDGWIYGWMGRVVKLLRWVPVP